MEINTEEVLTPPDDIQLDKDGVGLYFIHPTEEELKNFDHRQWMWAVSNNNPERKYKKGVRLAYFTSEQIEKLDRVKEHMAKEDQVLNNALVHCAEIVFPHLFSNPVDHSDEDAVRKAMYGIDEIRWGISNIHFRLREFARDVHKGQRSEDEIIEYFRNYIYRSMYDNEYFVKHLNILSKEKIAMVKAHLIGAIKFYHQYNLNYKEE